MAKEITVSVGCIPNWLQTDWVDLLVGSGSGTGEALRRTGPGQLADGHNFESRSATDLYVATHAYSTLYNIQDFAVISILCGPLAMIKLRGNYGLIPNYQRWPPTADIFNDTGGSFVVLVQPPNDPADDSYFTIDPGHGWVGRFAINPQFLDGEYNQLVRIRTTISNQTSANLEIELWADGVKVKTIGTLERDGFGFDLQRQPEVAEFYFNGGEFTGSSFEVGVFNRGGFPVNLYSVDVVPTLTADTMPYDSGWLPLVPNNLFFNSINRAMLQRFSGYRSFPVTRVFHMDAPQNYDDWRIDLRDPNNPGSTVIGGMAQGPSITSLLASPPEIERIFNEDLTVKTPSGRTQPAMQWTQPGQLLREFRLRLSGTREMINLQFLELFRSFSWSTGFSISLFPELTSSSERHLYDAWVTRSPSSPSIQVADVTDLSISNVTVTLREMM